MKKLISLFLASVMALSLAACGSNTSSNETAAETVIETSEEKLTLDDSHKQLIIDSINAAFASDNFASWSALYTEFTSSTPKAPEVTHIIHYTIDDFEGSKADCYMVNISADVACWIDEAAEMGAVSENFRILIDTETQTVYDSITLNADNGEHDTSTEEGRASYLLWIYGNAVNDFETGVHFVNEEEVVSVIADEDLEAIQQEIVIPEAE